MLTNEVQKLDLKAGGSLLSKWLNHARKGEEDILFIIGAGLSMTGYNVAPSGWDVSNMYENYLRAQGEVIPGSISGDIAKLYEYFCYPTIDGERQFSMDQHNNFIKCITTNRGQHRFIGQPNFQHRSLINEVIESKGRVRVYSLNLDAYFEVAESISDDLESDIVINVSDLLDKSNKENIFREWRILAAHGKNNINTRSVWSESLLTRPLSNDFPEYLEGEKKLLEKSLNCIKNGPNFNKVVFVGLAAPLTYLMTSLKNKVKDNFEWAWINPYDSPKEWVYKDTEKLFNNENGYWLKNSLDDLLWFAQAEFYERWLSVSCSINQDKIPLLDKYKSDDLKPTFVESIYRARRIYDVGIEKFLTAHSNFESIKVLNKNNHIYKYPGLDGNYKFYDSNLGFALHKLYIKNIELIQNSNEYAPNLTVAGRQFDANPISAHIFKFDPTVPEDKVANGIAITFDGVIIQPTHRHIIVIDVKYDQFINNLIKAIFEAVKERFPNEYMYIDVVKVEELEEFLNDQNFTKPPVRARRP
ncbi:hypothetical protein [Jeotgalibacillus marinus]|uniref:SIR2-like domain-containing protein n=1 Tax=Jeotgalibacillus marinus TaxID=86667 RepID=A0ABV3Q5G0_9BACL